jgi:PAS domain S-box-containing protein
MHSKKILLILLIGILISNFSPTQSSTDTGKKVDRLLTALENAQEKPERVNILQKLCQEYKYIDPKKALQYGKEGLELAEKIKFQKGIADCLNSIGMVHKHTGSYQEALEYLNRALKIGRAINSPEIIKNSAKELSELYAKQNQFQQAYHYHVLFKEKSDLLENQRYKFEKRQKQQRIEQKKEELAEQAEHSEHKQQRLLIYAFSGFALLLILAFYTRYYLKARTARQLRQEIDERKKTEEKLRESEEKFRALAEKSVVGICIVQDEVLKYINPRFLELFQYSSEELSSKSLLELVVEEDRPAVVRKYEKRVIGMADSIPFEYRALTGDGCVIHLEARGVLTNYEGKPAILETVIDITDRKKAEAELLKSRKLESMGILAGGIAHDFNNLLAVLAGNLSLAKMNINEPNPQLETYMDQAEMVSSQAAKLVKQFLTLSKSSWMTKEGVTLPDILKDTANASSLMKEIPYTTSIPNDLKPLWGDQHQLCQVFINLLLNAHEATSEMEEEKIITISAQSIHLQSDNEWELEEGEYVRVSMRDNGKGIPSHLLENIFDPYFSTKERNSQKGTGLGLALCYAVVKKHDGHISVISEPLKGTTFEMYLPVYNETKHGEAGVSC